MWEGVITCFVPNLWHNMAHLRVKIIKCAKNKISIVLRSNDGHDIYSPGIRCNAINRDRVRKQEKKKQTDSQLMGITVNQIQSRSNSVSFSLVRMHLFKNNLWNGSVAQMPNRTVNKSHELKLAFGVCVCVCVFTLSLSIIPNYK